MLEQLRLFFQRLFGGGEAPIIEDASDLGLDNIDNVPADTTNPFQRTRGMSSRSIDAAGAGAGSTPETITITSPRYLWCLDNGHGKNQKGKRSPLFEDGTRLEEWEFNRDIVKRMAEKLDIAGVQYFNVVPEEEVGSFLRERVQRANQKTSPLGLPKIFVSIHANALGLSDWDNRARGLEVWHYPGSNSGTRLASVFQRELLAHLPGWVDRGIKAHTKNSGKIFYVLGNTSMPAVLTENGFYTHEEEAKLLRLPETRQAIADAHVAAILKVEQDGWENIEPYEKSMLIG